jgi:hypothetical protein
MEEPMIAYRDHGAGYHVIFTEEEFELFRDICNREIDDFREALLEDIREEVNTLYGE